MEKVNFEKPAWLETLWNVNPSLAERAEADVVRWQTIEADARKAFFGKLLKHILKT